tara:strand:+ start:6266 stop:7564 length:1299 start_codon:yes stop_codon:yes gene_type:complete
MILNKIIKPKFLFIAVTLLSFFLSINLNPLDFESFNLFKKIRIISPLLLSLVFIFYRIKILKREILNFDLLLFSLIFILYIFFNLQNSDNDLLNIFWPIYMLLGLLFINCLKDNFEKDFLIKFTIIILLIAFIFYFSLALIDMIFRNNYHFYGVWGGRGGYSGLENPPRSSGLARMALILYCSFALFYLTKYNKLEENYYLLILISFFGISSLVFQSRTVSFIFLVLNIIIILFYFNNFISKKKLIFFFLLIPLILNSIYYVTVSYSIGKRFYDGENVNYDGNKKVTKPIQTLTLESIIRNKDTSSGRYKNWKLAYEKIKVSPLKGYGAQADRIYIKQSIHNGLIYTYLSGGLIACLLFIIIYFRTLFFLIKFLYLKKSHTNFNANFCISILIILNLRSVLETSFAVFSIDYLIYIIAYFLLRNNLNLNIKN